MSLYSRRDFLMTTLTLRGSNFWILSIALAVVANSSAWAVAARPSVLIMIADDQGWGDFSCHGNSNLATPQLDKLRGQGASFEHFYVQPVCAPTRAELLTACYAPRVGVTGVTGGNERLDPSVPTLADAFRAAGYRTAAFGKWHNGTQAPFHPLCRGFDSFYGFTSGHWADYFSPLLDRDGEITRGQGYLTDDITNEAIEFFKQAGEQPFFALMAFNTPHSPMQVPDRWWERHAQQSLSERGTLADMEKLDHTRAALAMCENIDWNVGRLLAALEEFQLDQNTIVVYLSDNGPNGHRFNGGLRGIKGSTDEGGVRSPLLIRLPGVIEPGLVTKQLAGVIDLAPTLAELAGVELLEGPARDGVSLAKLLRGQQPSSAERILYSHWFGRIAARRGTLVLDNENRLYDLSDDPGQTCDLAATRSAEAEELQNAVSAWRKEVVEANAAPRRPFTVGYPGLPATQLPARDATTRGNIRRSSRHFNSTFFSDWTSPEDAIVWDIEVPAAGRFRADAYYTCAEGDAGATVELRCGQHACQAQVAPAYDPPLTAAQRDRFPREEGDMKLFKPLPLGELTLESGRGELVLRALKIPGKSVMDLRLLELTRIE